MQHFNIKGSVPFKGKIMICTERTRAAEINDLSID